MKSANPVMSERSTRSTPLMVESWNEWGELETVIVGRALGAQVPPVDKSLLAINYADQPTLAKNLQGPYPEKVIQETEEDLENFCTELRNLGVEVLRPNPSEPEKDFSNTYWTSRHYYSYCPRDCLLVHGSKIIESPMPLRSRFFETYHYRDILLRTLGGNAQWLSAPKPRLLDGDYSTDSVHKDALTLLENEPCFDAANILRAGYDVFYLVSNSGNRLGALWLRSILGSGFRVHELSGIYSFMHIDSTISLLRPGLVLLNPERIGKDQVPKPLDQWEIIWCPPPEDIGYYGNYRHASTWIGMNLLMVRSDLAVVEKNQKALITELEKKGINVLPLSLRHSRTLGGSFHCVTLDLKRKSSLERYFS